MNRFSDFAEEETQFEGKKISIEDILNIEISVIGFNIKKSKIKNGNYLTLQIEMNGQKRVIFTGSVVLLKQCEKYQDMFPFVTIIKKIDKYFTFS